MAVPKPIELGPNSVAIAIDKGKNSQSAVQWTVDHFLKGSKDLMTVVLVHVKTHNYQSHMDYNPNGSTPSESEVKQLFLPYRGYCGRRGISAYEVVLHDIDVASALVSYVADNLIGNIAVGASNHNAFTRRFKQHNVPSSLEKSAPQFCTVYVIYKGRVHSMRDSNICHVTHVPPLHPNSKNTSKSSHTSSNNSKSGGNINGSDDQSTTSVHSSRPQSSSRLQGMGHSPSPYDNTKYIDNAHTPHRLLGVRRLTSPYNNSKKDNIARVHSLGHPPTSPYNTKNDDDYRIQVMEQPIRPPSIIINNNFDNLSRSQELGQLTSLRYSSSYDDFMRLQDVVPSPTHSHSERFDITPRFHRRHVSGDITCEYKELRTLTKTNSRKLTRTRSFSSDGLDDTTRQLKVEIKQAMDLYQRICEQATATAKKQAEFLHEIEGEDSIENIKLAREGAMIVAELERQKCQAAINAAQLTERLVKMETRKRKIAEERAAKIEEDGQKARNANQQVSHRVYTFKEIEVATNHFSDTLKIGEGGYGPVYRGILQHTPVAIKVLRSEASQGQKQFQKEIEVLGRIRHPNMVLLLGACTQYGCLVYEYLENGSLDDRLSCKNNTPPIPWRTRFRIAAEIGSALLFLHDSKPEPMVHRDLKPANILLDRNYTSKISDVGLARLVPPAVANQITQYRLTAAAGTFCYIDPEYQQTGMLGTKSDVYSLGILLLQLVTAKSPMALSHHVEEAIEEGSFDKVLDPSIDDWPVDEALALAKLALKCSEIRKKDRPDLDTGVLPELIRLRDLAIK